MNLIIISFTPIICFSTRSPKHACTTHRNPILMHGFHSMPWLGIQQVSLKSCRRWDSTFHRLMTIAQIDEPSALFDSVHWDSARVPLYSRSMDKGSFFFCQFWKLGFCSVSECPISAHRGRLCKFLDRECVARIPTWNLPKNASTTHWNPFLMHGSILFPS